MSQTPTEPSAAFQPHVPDEARLREFTLPAVLTGTCLGLVFAASSLYLVLKVGLTVSASIPVAVLAITLFRAFSSVFGLRKATILENNITQTAGSAGESIAFGVGVTMPALMLLGFGMDLPRVMLISVLGGLLGILAMIPLRRAFIVKMHGRPGQPGTLLYPEGTACAQVLISGEKGGTAGKTVFIGFGLAFLHKFVTEGMLLLTETVKLPVVFINKAAAFSSAFASELLGVGYIIGLRTSAIMMAGAVLGYLILIPLIYFIGEHAPKAIEPGKKPISEMSIPEIRNAYLLFIGAGCVATAGIISMLRTLPMIARGVMASFSGGGGGGAGGPVRRTDDDMPMKVVLFGSLGMILVLALFMRQEVDWVKAGLGAGLVVLFGFLFVTVSSRLTGEIGSSSNPISGMTVATLMLTCLIFVTLDMTSPTEKVLALSIAAVVCVASSNGGTTAQSLKTGYLVGGTPRAGQYAILIGAVVSSLLIGVTLILFNNSKAIYSEKPQNVPDVTLTQDELKQLKQSQTHNGVDYLVFDTRNRELSREVKEGRYLVDRDSGRLRFLVDYSIMGKLTQRDDGTPVTREFEAPKTQVMGIIINGVLSRDLNWSMVGMGAMIALMLELCGVSALAFAVGVYVPIQYSTPIFLGGLVRWLIDRRFARQAERDLAAAGDDPERRAQAEIDALRRSETSPGVLLASGYIAGGSIAGMLVAFAAFNDTLDADLKTYQYPSVTLGEALPMGAAFDRVAQRQTGLDRAQLEAVPEAQRTPAQKQQLQTLNDTLKELTGLNGNLPLTWIVVPKGTTIRLLEPEPYSPPEGKTLGQIAQELYGDPAMVKSLADTNFTRLKLTKIDEQTANVVPPAGVELLVTKRYVTEQEETLGQIARKALGRERLAATLYERNATILKLPQTLPAEAVVLLPQSDLPAYLAFLALIGVLYLVGSGRLFGGAPQD